MAEILKATSTASQGGLAEALAVAAAAGKTSTVETLLGTVADRFPDSLAEEAARALRAATRRQRWATAAYLADFLADTTRAGGEPGQDIEGEILRCLRGAQGDFVLTEAIVRCPAKEPRALGGAGLRPEAPPAIRFEHVTPDLPPQAFGGAECPSPYFNLSTPEISLAVLRGGDDEVIGRPEVRVVFDFPPPLDRTRTLSAPPGRRIFTRKELAQAVSREYQRLARSAPGAWRHELAELDLVGVAPDPENAGTYRLRVVA